MHHSPSTRSTFYVRPTSQESLVSDGAPISFEKTLRCWYRDREGLRVQSRIVKSRDVGPRSMAVVCTILVEV